MDAFGKDVILLETVGVGQSEVEVADAADASLVVLSPESGDGIQAMKAGLMEIADVIVMNKSDREGCDRAVTELELMLRLRETEAGAWTPPIVKTVATEAEGIAELIEALDRHRAHLESGDRLKRKRRSIMFKRIRCAADAVFKKRMWMGKNPLVEEAVERVSQGKQTPARAARQLFQSILFQRDRRPPDDPKGDPV
jgi:LAO/AO transport system kinase